MEVFSLLAFTSLRSSLRTLISRVSIPSGEDLWRFLLTAPGSSFMEDRKWQVDSSGKDGFLEKSPGLPEGWVLTFVSLISIFLGCCRSGESDVGGMFEIPCRS